MKKLTLGITAAVFLFSAPAMAQVPNDAPDPAMQTEAQAQTQLEKTTVTGVVVSSTADQLLLRTQDGRQLSLAVGPEAILPNAQLQQGASVSVDYRGDASSGMDVVAVRQDLAAQSGKDTSPALIASDADPMNGSDAESRSTLPQTASPVPLIGLVSLLALGGAAYTRCRMG